MRLPVLSGLLAVSGLGALARAGGDKSQKPLVSSSSSSSSSSSAAPPYRESLLALHKALIEHSSTSGAEGDVGNWLIAYLAAHNYTAVKQPLPPRNGERFNVIAWPAAPSADDDDDVAPPPLRLPIAPLMISSHIDVVPPHIPYSIDNGAGPVTRDTLVRGRGSVDAKASVAAQITAVEALRASGELAASKAEDTAAGSPPVVLLFVVGEEDSGDGMKVFSHYMQAQQASQASQANQQVRSWFNAVIFGEPTENHLACGHKGILGCTITATGKAGHSGYPWLGRSANELLVHGLAAVLDADLGASPIFGNTTVNIGRMAGGVASNVIPAAASANLSVRVALGPQSTGHDEVHTRIEAAIEQVAARYGGDGDDDRPLRVECPFGYGVVECACDVTGFETITVNYGTDVPNLAGNHTRYLYGPGDILVAHSDHEAIRVGDLETAVEDYKTLIKHVLAKSS